MKMNQRQWMGTVLVLIGIIMFFIYSGRDDGPFGDGGGGIEIRTVRRGWDSDNGKLLTLGGIILIVAGGIMIFLNTKRK